MRAVKSVVVYPVGSYARISYPSRSTICKDHLPWMSLQLQVSQVDRVSFIRSYRLLTHHALVRKSGFPTSPTSIVFFFLRINHIFVKLTALRRTRGHVTVRTGSHCENFGCPKQHRTRMVSGPLGLALDPGANFPSSINAHVMVAFGRMAGVSTTTTSELALLRAYHPTKIRFRWHC
jgi:hypothetical protein